jgi:hypothetical protein
MEQDHIMRLHLEEESMPGLRNYHIILMDGTERNVRAEAVEVSPAGVLAFSNAAGKGRELQVAYAPQQWKMVEVERQDDKGE